MNSDLTQANIIDILVSVSNANDVDIKNKVLDIVKDCKHLNEIELKNIKKYEDLCDSVGGVPTVQTLVAKDSVFSNGRFIAKESIVEYAKIFINNIKNRKMGDIISKNVSEYQAGNINFDKFTLEIQKALGIGSPNKMEENVKSNIDDDFYEELTNAKQIERGIGFGVKCIDEKYRGLLPGELLTIAGYTGSMKTTLSANVAYNAATLGKNTLYISLEVSAEDLTYALLARHSMSNTKNPITRKEMPEYAVRNKEEFLELAKDYNNLPGKIRIVDEGDITTYSTTAFNDVIEKVNEELKEKTGKGIDIIVVDHIQLLKFSDAKSATDNPYFIVNYFTSYFREKAAREGYAVILVSQTSRQGYEYACKHRGQYLETALAEANELERASTGIVTVFATDNGRGSNEITVQLIKNRFGEKMPEPKQAPLLADYFMIGMGTSLEPEEVGPAFEESTNISNFFQQQNKTTNMSIDDLLNSLNMS